MSDRRFGVEIELGIDNAEWDAGIVDGRYMTKATKVANALTENFGPEWGDVDLDGTELEIRSPILQGEQGFRVLHEVMTFLREHGGYTTEEDGMHVHHDAPDFVYNGKAVVRLVKSWYQNQDLIDHFCAEYRADWGYCPKTWNEFTIADLEDHFDEYLAEGWDERGALNIDSLRVHGTIEIRQHEGTLDPVQAEAWIKFGQAFIDNVATRTRRIKCAGTTEALLKYLKLPEDTRKQLLSRAA